MLSRLINYLRSNFDVSQNAVALATKAKAIEPHILPIVLWQYGFLNISQLEQVLDWLEMSY